MTEPMRSAGGSRADLPVDYSLRGKRVWVAGHTGMVGSALVRRLRRDACTVLTVERSQLDLRRQAEVEAWVAASRPEVVLMAAATVGGIHANRSRPADFIYDNLAIVLNVVAASFRGNVEKLLYLGSSCIYPKFCSQPMTEDLLLSGPLEPTNEAYATAKLSGIMLARAFRTQWGMDCICALPTNLYGPGDSFDLQNSHVVPALLRKLHEAKEAGRDTVEIWGTGQPRREFLHVDDAADAIVFLATRYSGQLPVNIGCGEDISIAELADVAAEVVGFRGRLVYNREMPDGTPQKLLDVARMNALGWRPRISLKEGLRDAYAWYLTRVASGEPVGRRLSLDGAAAA